MEISSIIDRNIFQMELYFKDCGDITKRKFQIGKNQDISAYVMYIDMLTNTSTINDYIMQTLQLNIRMVKPTIEELSADTFSYLKDGGVTVADIKEVKAFDECTTAVLNGDTILFIDGFNKAIVISTKGYPSRGVPKAETEIVIQGAKDAFSEVFRINTMLIRRRIKDTRLKIYQTTVGEKSKSDVALVYLEDVVRNEILDDLKERISNIKIDAILDSGYLEQLIEDDWLSPFPQIQTTERPDKAAAAILEGRVVVIVDNTPFALIVPSTFNSFFQSPDDYYLHFEFSSFMRGLRFLAAFLALTFPGLYLATTIFHPSMLPMQLAFKLAAARQNVPFPAVFEILIMELAFELLREAGIRLPAPIGGTIGIVGGIIVGQAAVEAGIVSPIVVIIVAFTGICSFTLPNTYMSNAIRILKYVVIAFSATLGFYGFWLALLLIAIHLCSLKSFDIPYMYPFVSSDINDNLDALDSVFRAPLFLLKRRPIFASSANKTRLAKGKEGNKHRKE